VVVVLESLDIYRLTLRVDNEAIRAEFMISSLQFENLDNFEFDPFEISFTVLIVHEDSGFSLLIGKEHVLVKLHIYFSFSTFLNAIAAHQIELLVHDWMVQEVYRRFLHDQLSNELKRRCVKKTHCGRYGVLNTRFWCLTAVFSYH